MAAPLSVDEAALDRRGATAFLRRAVARWCFPQPHFLSQLASPRTDRVNERRTPESRERQSRLVLLCIWCLVVAIGVSRHEYWRDEVRAFSLARNARSLVDLLASMKNEGHPVLWHLILHGAFALTASPLVLPITSVAVAGAAVALFVFRCPIPLWVKALFVFGRLGAYEYSVVARNYGISMLLLFVFGSTYRQRGRHPLFLGFVLACLSNTNVHSLILAGLLTAYWLWDDLLSPARPVLGRAPLPRLAMASLIFALGAGFALRTVWPSAEMLPSDAMRYTARNVLGALWSTVRDPANHFQGLVPRTSALVLPSNLVLLAVTLLLIGRPAAVVAVWAAICALSVFFEIVYPGGYRHQGLLVVFLLTLRWMTSDIESPVARRSAPGRLQQVGLYGGLALILVISVGMGGYALIQDIRFQQSASREFGDFLAGRPEFANAILIGEPDFYLESMPYYANNPIYVVREHRFGDTVSFTRRSKTRLGLRELMTEAWAVHVREKREVLIALGHTSELEANASHGDQIQSVTYSFGRTIWWSNEDLRIWKARTRPIARFVEGIISDERYVVYEITGPPSVTPTPGITAGTGAGQAATVGGPSDGGTQTVRRAGSARLVDLASATPFSLVVPEPDRALGRALR